MAQYRANHPSFAFLTMATIALQANRPARKAETNPTTRQIGLSPPPSSAWPVAAFRMSRACSPMIGIRTIRKENCAMTSRFTPQRRPVAMVVPERDSPGATAKAWPIPTTKACQKLIPLRVTSCSSGTDSPAGGVPSRSERGGHPSCRRYSRINQTTAAMRR